MRVCKDKLIKYSIKIFPNFFSNFFFLQRLCPEISPLIHLSTKTSKSLKKLLKAELL